MARGRLQVTGAPLVDTGVNAPGVAVVAQPVDTFVRPAVDTQAAQLATALGKLSPALAGLGNVIQEKQNQTQLQAGRNAASELHRLGKDYATEVKAGRLAPNHNPFFMAGLNETQGQNAADDFGAHLEASFNEAMKEGGVLSQSTNIDDFKKFAGQVATDYQKAHNFDSADPRFLTGFSGRADQFVNAYEMKFASGIAARTTQQATDAIYTQIRNHTLTELRRGTSLEEIAKGFVSQFQFWSGSAGGIAGMPRVGLNGRVVNETQLRAALDAAWTLSRSTSDTDRALARQIPRLLDMVPGGPAGSGSLLNQKWAGAIAEPILDHVDDQVNQGDAHSAAVAKAEHEDQANQMMGDILHLMRTDPTNPEWRSRLDALSQFDPGKAISMEGAAAGVLSEASQSNLGLYQYLYRGITLGNFVTPEVIARAVHPGGITIADADNLNSALQARIRQQSDKDPLHDATYEQVAAAIPGLFTKQLGDGEKTFFQAENSEVAYSVRASLAAAYSTWKAEHPTANDAEQLKFLNDTLEGLTRLQPEDARPRQGILSTGPATPPTFADFHKQAIITPEEYGILLNAHKTGAFEHPTDELNRIVNKIAVFAPNAKFQEFMDAQAAFFAPAVPDSTAKP